MNIFDELELEGYQYAPPDNNGEFPTPLDGALFMAERGIRQIPLHGKAPFMPGWQDLATTDPKQIKQWAEDNPGCNFGSVAKQGEYFVFEVDSGEVKNRFENRFSSEFTIQSSAADRGHRWYQAIPGLENISQTFTKQGDWSLRVHNEQCVSPGSIHPVTGQQYKLVGHGVLKPPTQEEVEFWKSEKLDKIVQAEPQRNSDNLIPKGSVHGYMLHHAGKLRRQGLGEEPIKACLYELVEENCEHPIDWSRVDRMAHSICNFPKGTDGELILDQAQEIKMEEVLPIVTIDGDTFLTEKIPPRKVLIQTISTGEPVIYEQSINQIFAWRGEGKTCLGLGFVRALTTLEPFLNFMPIERQHVLYVEGELPDSQFQERWRSIVGKTDGYAHLASLDKQPGHHYQSLATDAGIAKIEKTLEQFKQHGKEIKVLMLDNISTLFNVKANDEEVWIGIQNWFISLRSRGLTVFFFHHAGKGGLSRSHSKSEDMLDISIQLEAPDKASTDTKQLHTKLIFDKARAGLNEKPAEIKLHRTHSADCKCGGNPVLYCPGDGVRWEHIPRASKKDEAFQMFAVGGSVSAVSQQIEIPRGTVARWRVEWGLQNDDTLEPPVVEDGKIKRRSKNTVDVN